MPIFTPHPYQKVAIQWLIDKPFCGLFLDMGLGKTSATLAALKVLMHERFEVGRVLVIAPRAVALNSWPAEIAKWDNFNTISYTQIAGTPKQRNAALRELTDIHIISRDLVGWLVGQRSNAWPYDTIILDESSSFKNHDSQRFKSLKHIRPVARRVVLLTGTPAPNSLADLWAQVYLLDMGKRLGKNITGFRKTFMDKHPYSQYQWAMKSGADNAIWRAIGDVCVSMKAADHLDMPELVDNYIPVRLSDSVAKQYATMQADAVLDIIASATDEEGNVVITAAHAASLSNKLRQIASGAVYDADRNVHRLHEEKLDALQEVLESTNGQNVLLFYNYTHERDRIMERFASYKPELIKEARAIDRWNAGKIRLLIGHPASAGHGLNLQSGGRITIFYGPDWSLELRQQAAARLYRQGQRETTYIHTLHVVDTIEDKIILALQGKADVQNALLDAVKSLVNTYKK